MNTDASGVATPDQPIHWRLAAKGLIGLAKDTSRTDHVFTIISALTGNSFNRTYDAFRRTDYGQRLLLTKPSLMAVLSDREKLEAMPEGSLGREYLRFMDGGKLTAQGLVAAQDSGVDPNADRDLDPDRAYVADRMRDMHDLWHVLTDYGCDDTGEIANLWFSVGQFGNPGMAFIAFFGILGGGKGAGLGWVRFCYRAYRRGKEASRLVSEPVEELLDQPIGEVRKRLRIACTSQVHPEGMRYGYRRDGQLGALPSPALTLTATA